MKVIILCAGKGRRFKIRTPKCLLKIGNETLVEKCLNNFKDNNIKSKDIIFASGFKENLIKLKIKIMKIQIWFILFLMQSKK